MELRDTLPKSLSEESKGALEEALRGSEATHALLLNTEKISDALFFSRYPHIRKHPYVEHAYLYDKNEYPFGKSIYYENGAISIEDGAAMMVNYFLKPEKDDIILDICAAPGGKSIGASLMMEDKGCIIANDISYPRAKALSQNIERMGRGNIIAASTDFVFSHVHFAEMFDKILVDAPCSGSAMFRKDHLSLQDWRAEKVKANAKRQKDLLELAYGMLKPGGVLAYSTCSFSYDENEGQMLAFKERHPEIEFVNLPEDEGLHHNEELPQSVTLYPHEFLWGEGQFICLFKKPGELIKTPRKVKDADKFTEKYKDFLGQYGLSERSNETMRNKFYSIYQHFDTSHLNLLRYGVKLFEMRPIYIPDHHLAHFLDDSYSIAVKESDMKAYINGETFPLDLPDGFYIISFDHMNLGFVKVTNGVAKNHYPKGLRKKIELF